MKSLRSLVAAAGLAAALSISTYAAEDESGAIDIGSLVPATKGEFVEVNLSPFMLKFAAKIAAGHDKEAAALLGNLTRVRVNVVSLDDSNREGAVAHISEIRRKLENQGWNKMVTVREKNDGDDVNVHIKQRGEDAIAGLVVTVIDHKGEAVIVNIVGNITADQIAKVGRELDIEPLHGIKVKLKKHHKHHDKDDDKDEDEEA
jgi:hypothetical protein